MELFKSMTGTNIVHIPYKGSAGVLADVMGGQIAVTIDNMPPYIPQVKAGKLRALAVSTAKRSSAMPELPSIAEAGVSGYDSGAWFGLLAPAGTPKDVVAKLSAETARIIRLPDIHKRVSELGAEPVGGKPEEFAALIQSEIAKWAKVIKDAKVELL
jgi:tripartite-type tricarboxylate transporter receptor subunit TctC